MALPAIRLPAPPPGAPRLALLLLLAALAIAGAGASLNQLLAERLLRSDAEATARQLGLALLANPAAPPEALPATVLHWRLLDAEGALSQEASATAPTATPALRRLTAVRVPLDEAGATLEATLDQSERKALYRQAFLMAELALGLLGLLATGLLGWLALRRAREQAAEARAAFLSRHDTLTGLANHSECRDRLEAALALASRQGFRTGVLVLDLRRFREVNDAHGRASGDAVLNVIAGRLRAAVRREDTVARLSADRFAIVQSGIAIPLGAARLAERLASTIAQPVQVAGGEIVCAADIGFAVAPEDGGSAELLLARAEGALGVARAGAEPGIRCFEPGQDAALRQRRDTERDLRLAIADHQLVLHWQPQRRIGDGRLLGFEALLRWPHPERGMIPPNDFIPLAESSGMIIPLGAWVIRTACAEAARWPGGFKAAVNLSPAQFRHGALVATVQEALAVSGLPPHRLELEVTESLLQQDTESAVRLLRDLRELGVTIAMDDFGTGWSSLAHLWRFPFGKLKIDRAFVKELGQDPKLSAIVATIVGLGRTLDMAVVAEGVETDEQARLLLAQGCEQGQGWLYGKPMSAEAARTLIAQEMQQRRRSAA
jgi:diguanylate cyclase (GGDEF)-like protein